jgi:hypothetical protein
MPPLGRNVGTPRNVRVRLYQLCVFLLFCLGAIPRAHAGATLLLEEPYSYDGAFAGTGHAAVYLSHVCSASPVVLRPCALGESGVVLSRYKDVAGYDWVAIPLVPYLYAVDEREDIPLFANAKLVAFLRDQYRRKYLESVAPDRAGGGSPGGDWYELIGASYDRTIYAFEIETSPEQDALLISKFNSRPNRKRYSFLKGNCADFAREVINFYYPHALHRSVIGDMGVTTPKQIAKMLAKYGARHPGLQTSAFVIPQVPGALRPSKPIHGVLESVLAAKKYMLPLFVIHPYISGSLLAAYLGHRRFNPARHALVLDSSSQMDAPMTSADRRFYQGRLDELTRAGSMVDGSSGQRNWTDLQAAAVPDLDPSGKPMMQVHVGSEVKEVGISRANVLSASESSELAASLLQARIRQELQRATVRKTAHRDVENDLELLRQLLSVERSGFAGALSSTSKSPTQATTVEP